jgi:Ca-activated chloride channel homolog
MNRIALSSLTLLLVTTFASVNAQGRLILEDRRNIRPPHVVHRPPRRHILPIQVKDSRIESRIQDRVAVTEVKQTFYNPNPMQLEGHYLFPLPPDATVGKFSLTAGGKVMKGEVLPRDKARGIYEDIVRRQRDPALLEYLDWGLFKARVFPIPPRGDVILALTYESVLETDGGTTLLRFPFASPGATTAGGGRLVMKVNLETSQPLKSVYSPSHRIDVVRKGDHHAIASYEGSCLAGKDFLFYFACDERPFGLNVLTHKKPGEPGFFLAMISPKVAFDRAEVDPKDVVLVLDTSGSMKGEKIKQAVQAAKYCLQSLDPRDRFNVIGFSTEARPFRDRLVEATPDNVKAALAFLDGQEALGGTNIHQALLTATRSLDTTDRVGITLFLTDGIPTVDVIDKNQILKAVQKGNQKRNRIFVFGVGSDVNTKLLDLLAEQNRGTRTYVGAGESIEVKVSSFYEKVRYPVLSDLKLEVVGLTVFDTYPRDLPDLFKGSQLLVMGRYTDAGQHALKLSGSLKDATRTFVYEADFPAECMRNDFIPRLWAMRKVGYLLDQVRLHGAQKELVDSIVALGKRYGIVTPYTSFLVIEDEQQLATRLRRFQTTTPGTPSAPSLDLATDALKKREERARRAATSTVEAESGDEATRVSQAANKLRGATTPGAPSPSASGTGGGRRVKSADGFAGLYFGRLGRSKDLDAKTRKELNDIGYGYRVAGDHTFVYSGGIWVDTLYEAATMRKSLIQVEAFSKRYFELLKTHSELGRLLTVGKNCIVVVGGKAYHVVSLTVAAPTAIDPPKTREK